MRGLAHKLFTALTLAVAMPLAFITLVFATVALTGLFFVLVLGEQYSRVEQRKLGCPDE